MWRPCCLPQYLGQAGSQHLHHSALIAARRPVGSACQTDDHCSSGAICSIVQWLGANTTINVVYYPPLAVGTCSECSNAAACQEHQGSSGGASLCSEAAGACVNGLLPGDDCTAGSECRSGVCLPSRLCGEHEVLRRGGGAVVRKFLCTL